MSNQYSHQAPNHRPYNHYCHVPQKRRPFGTRGSQKLLPYNITQRRPQPPQSQFKTEPTPGAANSPALLNALLQPTQSQNQQPLTSLEWNARRRRRHLSATSSSSSEGICVPRPGSPLQPTPGLIVDLSAAGTTVPPGAACGKPPTFVHPSNAAIGWNRVSICLLLIRLIL